MNYLSNAFSLNMVGEFPVAFKVARISLEEAVTAAVDRKSAVGHPDSAAMFAEQLGRSVVHCRENLSLKKGDSLLVGQYRGPRLPRLVERAEAVVLRRVEQERGP